MTHSVPPVRRGLWWAIALLIMAAIAVGMLALQLT